METLATALYVKIDDLLLAEPELAPWRPEGSLPTVSDAELLAMAVMSACSASGPSAAGCGTAART